MSKEQESFDRIKLFIDHMNDDFDSEDVSAVDNALERLEEIDNADPSEAIKHMEFICKILKEKGIDVKWVFKEDYTTIIHALLKAQEQEKEKLFFKNIHNTKVNAPLVSIFEGLSKEERHKFTEHLYYHWEEMKEALEDKNNELEKENIELKKHAMAWDIVKEKNVDLRTLKACFKVECGLQEYNKHQYKENELTEKEFNILKEALK